MRYVASTLHSLANLHWDKKEFDKALDEYEEALQIVRKLAQDNPSDWAYYVASTLHNLANLHWDKKEFDRALGEYEEALQIRRQLAKNNRIYSNVAMTLTALSMFYLQVKHNREKSIVLALEIIEISLQFQENLEIQKYRETAIKVLNENKINSVDLKLFDKISKDSGMMKPYLAKSYIRSQFNL